MRFLKLTRSDGAATMVSVDRIQEVMDDMAPEIDHATIRIAPNLTIHVRESFEEVAAMLGCGTEPEPAESEWRTFVDKEPYVGQLIE